MSGEIILASLAGGLLGGALATAWLRWRARDRMMRAAAAAFESEQSALALQARWTAATHNARKYLKWHDDCACLECSEAFVAHKPRPHARTGA